jgi:cytochrome d ubiquinol oxidase subunit II
MMGFDLSFIWAGLIAFAVIAYVVLDGFDLGIGMLFAFFKREDERDQMMNTVAPVWDGNETWLVLGGGGLLAVFPLAYAVVMPALYIPIIVMLLGLVLRGVAFEFRWRTTRAKYLWDLAFIGGSLIATIAQGLSLGTLVQGIPVANRAYTGGALDWLSPFSVFTAAALVAGYMLLGAGWLIIKTDGFVQERSYGFARVLAFVTLGLIAAVSLWTPFLNPAFFERWFSWPWIAYSWPIPILVAGAAVFLIKGVAEKATYAPFLASLALFILCYIGIGISFYPHIVPPSLLITEAAAPDDSLFFLLIGAMVLIPIILAYTAYSYWVFRGKVRIGDGYH